MTIEYKVGQQLWFVRTILPGGRGYDVQVHSIGRKWVNIAYTDRPTIKAYRVEVGRVDVDGGEFGSPGRLYLTQADYESELGRARTWVAFRRALDCKFGTPPGVSVDDMRAAAKLLGLGPLTGV